MAKFFKTDQRYYTRAEVDTLLSAYLAKADQIGSVIGSGYAAYATSTALTAAIPVDDTIPQSSEGTQILSVAYTPKRAASKMRIRFQGWCGQNSVANATAALFNGSASAVSAATVTFALANSRLMLGLEHEYAPGSVSPITFTIRVGPDSGTLTMNGFSGGRFLGGVGGSTLIVEEILVS